MANVSKNLNGVVTTGAGSAAPFGGTPGAQVHVYSAAGSSATVLIQGAMFAAGPWKTLGTITNPDATGELWQGTSMPYMRANVSARASGTLTAAFRDLPNDPGAWALAISGAASTALGHSIIKFPIVNADVVALGAAMTGDITVGTLPAKSRLVAAYIDVTGAETSANALTVALGTVAAAYVDWIVASDAKTAALYGNDVSERGATVLDGQLFYVAATPIKAHFIKATTNLSTATAFAATVYVEYVTYP